MRKRLVSGIISLSLIVGMAPRQALNLSVPVPHDIHTSYHGDPVLNFLSRVFAQYDSEISLIGHGAVCDYGTWQPPATQKTQLPLCDDTQYAEI